MASDEDGVSVVVRRRIHPELQAPFEAWLTGIIEVASTFEGHLGAQVLRPPDVTEQDYVLLFRFAKPSQLAAWQDSSVARDWLERGKTFTKGEVQIEQASGLEFWFHVPDSAGRRPPPKHKMALATVVGLYPLILLVAPLVAGPLEFLPRPLNVLITVFTMVLLMTYVVMPLVTRALARWLF